MPGLLSRRGFLRLGLLGGIGLSLAALGRQAGGRGLGPFLRDTLRRSWLTASGARSAVGIAACPSYDAGVTEALRSAWRLVGEPDLRGRRVILKPNLVSYIAGPPGNTDARLVEAAITVCRQLGAAEVVVAEGPAFVRDVAPVLQMSGLADVLNDAGARFVDLNYDELAEVVPPGGYARLPSLSLPKTVLGGDCVISLPKMKTHHWAGVSLSLKNLFGVVPGARYGWPKNALHVSGIPLAVLDLYDALRPEWAIVDGVVGMEGDGPLLGQAVPTGALIVGRDLVAVDAVCCRLMGVLPESVDYLAYAQAVGLGWIDTGRIDVRGVPVKDLARAYAPPPS